jgi:hypothetical protein
MFIGRRLDHDKRNKNRERDDARKRRRDDRPAARRIVDYAADGVPLITRETLLLRHPRPRVIGIVRCDVKRRHCWS